jgi:preprotein translocase SecF subunit
MGGLKPSIEFKGGTQEEVSFNSPQTQESVRHAILAAGYKDNEIQMGQAPNGQSLAYISVTDRATDAYLGVEKALTTAGISFNRLGHGLVGGSISKELTNNAFEAVGVAAGLIVVYMAFAFAMGGFVAGLRFGFSAIAALLHDVLVLIGSFAILGYFLDWQINSLFVTATLTVVGFSVHDTIVIFDRLRENLRHKLRTDSFEELANRSILQSFARSINTSFTVVLTLIAMLILGEPSTRLLNVALLIGIISGTYSSIFNATPILVDWENWLDKKRGGSGVASVEAVAAAIGADKPAVAVNGGGAVGSGGTYVTYLQDDTTHTPSAGALGGAQVTNLVKSSEPVANGTVSRPVPARAKKKSTKRF